ncbi:MAG: tRNA (adenosine(37)-N6)-threonylcarbamoyltransferase complex transferase subunit TsaD [Planctomycetes bacterium]|nr:tRNA (adenosine(37)-N6)-threonylcarbamoyltransferase complex transferase subunit TsaD [Planctomycetota bacterium]
MKSDGRRVILGIESSCDETAAAVVVEGRRVLSSVVASQIDLHRRFGGVVPEIASRAHIEAVNTVIAQAMKNAAVGPEQIDAIAVTHEPGLIGSLLVGLMAAKTLAWAWSRPLIGVNHVYAHAYAAALDAEPIDYPAVALVCSGGHTALYRCDSPTRLKLLGATIDDAAGEAFDKVASILGLGYPGGPEIDSLAKGADAGAVRFPRTLLHGQSLDFSFSGLKTAVLYHVRGVPGRSNKYPGSAPATLTESQIADVAASFQAAAVDVLRIKLRRAAVKIGARSLVLGGGVAANSALRQAITELAEKLKCSLRLPPLKYCLDNAAMIAGLAWHYLDQGVTANLELDALATVKR